MERVAYPYSRPHKVPLAPGDTLQAIASRILGDPSRWYELAQINGLVWPYLNFDGPGGTPSPGLFGDTSGSGNGAIDGSTMNQYALNGVTDWATEYFTPAFGGRVLGVGDILNIPMPWTAAAPPIDPIGVDMKEQGQHGELVHGQMNLAGALLRRLRTPRYYLPHRPGYGSKLRWFVGKAASVSVVLAIRRDVAATLLQDPRVLEVISVTADLQADAVWIAATVKTPLGPVEVAGNVMAFMPDPIAMELANV